MFESFVGAVAAVVVAVAHVRLEHAASVGAAEEVLRALYRSACRRLVRQVFAIGST